MERTILKNLAFIVGGCFMALNANANNFECWTPGGGANVKIDPTTNVVSIDNNASGDSWDCQFNPPTWYAPSKGKSEAFEISFDAMYVGAGTDGDGKGNITFIQGRQFGGYAGDWATLCLALGIEEQDAGWKIQNVVEQLYVEEFDGMAEDFAGGLLTRNVNFYPTAEWQHFSFSGHLGRHAADSVDISMEFGKIAGSYAIKNFVFKVKGVEFTSYYRVVKDENFSYDIIGNQYAVVKNFNDNVKNVTIPQTVVVEGKEIPVTDISGYAFMDCNNLVSVTIPNGVTTVGGGAFYNCKNLKSITFGSSLTEIGSSTFFGCESLTSIDIPDSVAKIGSYAFCGCESLTSIDIPDSVTIIGYGSFLDCRNLKSITFGGSVAWIDDGIFEGCDSLRSIICMGAIPPVVNYFTFSRLHDAILYSNVTLSYPEGSNTYRKLQPWSNFDFANDTNYWHTVDTIYVVDTVFNFVSKTDTIFSSRIDTVYVIDTVQSIVNTKDTVFSSRIDTVYNIINKIDTVYSIITSRDTVYFGGQSAKMYNLMVMSANPTMGMAIGTGSYSEGSVVEIFAIEKYGYHFTKWSDGNTENPRFVNIAGGYSFTAQFEVNNYSVLAAANESVMGAVEGAATYTYLSRTQLKATPNAGYEFKEWSDGETANPRNILVYSDTTFMAVFAAIDATAVAENAANAINIYAHGRTIIIENATDEIRVYDAMGRLVGRDVARNVCTMTINNSGVYIVKIGNVVKRVMVN